MHVLKLKLVVSDYQKSSALRATLGQKGLPFKEVVSRLERQLEGYPEGASFTLRITIFSDDFSIEVMGPTSTYMIRTALPGLQELDEVGESDVKKVLEMHGRWMTRAGMDESACMRIIRAKLRSMHVKVVGQVAE